MAGGGSSGETKIAEGIRDAKTRRFVLYNAFAGKSGGGGGGLQPPGSAAHAFFAIPTIWNHLEFVSTEHLIALLAAISHSGLHIILLVCCLLIGHHHCSFFIGMCPFDSIARF